MFFKLKNQLKINLLLSVIVSVLTWFVAIVWFAYNLSSSRWFLIEGRKIISRHVPYQNPFRDVSGVNIMLYKRHIAISFSISYIDARKRSSNDEYGRHIYKMRQVVSPCNFSDVSWQTSRNVWCLS